MFFNMRNELCSLFWAITLGTISNNCFAREPACSRFHYEENLLEKMIRSEFKIDAIEKILNTVTASMKKKFQAVSDTTSTVEELKKQIEMLKTADVASSSTYTRWGRRTCPGDAELVYEGFAGGGHYSNAGASSNYICLPNDPIIDADGRKASNVNRVYGAEYETSSATFHTNLHDHDVPCAVCRVVGRSTVMIPARDVCYSGWHTEYSGNLMSSLQGHTTKEIVCMDGTPEDAQGNDSGSQNGALFYFVQIMCGSLKCPPYREQVALSCVVCSK